MTLTQSRLKEVLDYNPETGFFIWKIDRAGKAKVGSVAGSSKTNRYRQIMVDGIMYHAHRLAWFYVHGSFPLNMIDHINHQTDDNRIKNLREATRKQNRENLFIGKNNTSGHIGVYWYKPTNKWQAKIGHNKKIFHLGYFEAKEKAIEARKKAEQQFFYTQGAM